LSEHLFGRFIDTEDATIFRAFIHEPTGVETFNVITLDLCDVKTLAGETVTHGG